MRRLFLGVGLAAALCVALLVLATVLLALGGRAPSEASGPSAHDTRDRDRPSGAESGEGSMGAAAPEKVARIEAAHFESDAPAPGPAAPPPEPMKDRVEQPLLGGLGYEGPRPRRSTVAADPFADGEPTDFKALEAPTAAPGAPGPDPALAALRLEGRTVKLNLARQSGGTDLDDMLSALNYADNKPSDGSAAQGLALRGAGSGGGGEGFGRVHGMGKIDTGGGRGTKARLGGKRSSTRRSLVTQGEPTITDLPVDALEEASAHRPNDASNGEPSTEVANRPAPKTADKPVQRLDQGVVWGDDTQKSPDEALAWIHPDRFEAPRAALPRTFYFENTYLGRGAGYLEQLSALSLAFGPGVAPWRWATLPEQPIDPPTGGGLALSVALSEAYVDRPQRVYLQVSLRGSERAGWRRPPLDQVVVIDPMLLLGRRAQVVETLDALAARLGPQDQVAVVWAADPPRVLLPLGSARALRGASARLPAGAKLAESAEALALAGTLLSEAAQGRARVPGSGTVLWLASSARHDLVAATAAAAHTLTLQGATTSVIAFDPGRDWWPVAQAGHGNHHADMEPDAAVAAELDALARVIARLLRVNITLGPDVEAIRVLGSRVLDEQEKAAVKAREVATDQQISKTLGVKSDRGDDDDGLQTVIPAFHGGDAHVIIVELWVKKAGPVADVSLRAKDMVTLANATARAGASLGLTPRPVSPAQLAVRDNVRGFTVAEQLGAAAVAVRRGETRRALDLLSAVPGVTRADQRLLAAFRRLLRERSGGHWPDLAPALALAGRQRISHALHSSGDSP